MRRLRSDLLIIAEANVGWVEFRDTFEADGQRVRDRDNRAAQLFLKPDANALQQAKRIAGESARFNLSPQRLCVQPHAQRAADGATLPAAAQPDSIDISASIASTRLRVVVKFKEQASPRLIASEDGAAASGSFTLDPASGRVVRTEFRLATRRVLGTFTVEYAEQPALKLWLPASMVERYIFPAAW